MNLIIDVGNTQFKIAVFKNSQVVFHEYYKVFGKEQVEGIFDNYPIKNAIFSDTRGIQKSNLEAVLPEGIPLLELSHSLNLPLKIDYYPPETLGKDRIAAAVGAYNMFPQKNLLIIDIGTALTVDFVSAHGVFEGGIISPGPMLRYRALNEFTGKLPLYSLTEDWQLTGKNTRSAIEAGVQNGLLFEINEYILRYTQQWPDLKVILTGGYANLFDKKINCTIFAESKLVPMGLNSILKYNEKYES
jgi:type III pantothenate kinase